MIVRGRGFLALLGMTLVLTGCGFFSRSKSRFFTLERIGPATPVAGTGTRGLPVAIDVVELPPGFDRRDIVVRQADHKLEVREKDQWSGQLEPSVLHTLAFNLADRLPEGMVILPGQLKPSGVVRGIDLVVEEFAAGPESAVTLDARWILREAGRPDVTHHEQIRIDLASLDSPNVASGFSQALAQLADRMAARL